MSPTGHVKVPQSLPTTRHSLAHLLPEDYGWAMDLADFRKEYSARGLRHVNGVIAYGITRFQDS